MIRSRLASSQRWVVAALPVLAVVLASGCFPDVRWEDPPSPADKGVPPENDGEGPAPPARDFAADRELPSDGQAGTSPPLDTGAPESGPPVASDTSPDGSALVVTLEAPATTACSGQPLVLDVHASGGVPPYRWSVADADALIELDAVDPGAPGAAEPMGVAGDAPAHAAARVQWSLAESGPRSLSVSVTDSLERSAQGSLDVWVHDTPRLSRLALDPVCDGQVVRAELEAKGGDPASYLFTLGPELAGLGLSLDGASLAGHLQMQEAGEALAPTERTGTVQVSDAHCAAPPVAVSLPILAPGAAECPRIGIEGAEAGELPAPCRGAEYSVAFQAAGGKAPYRWQEVSLPAGWRFDRDNAIATGVPRGAGELVLELGDGTGRTLRQSYPFTPRESCWLGYLAAAPGPTRLHLLDPVLDPLIDGRRQLPVGDDAPPALDFEFSPDGEFLAYRSGDTLESARLALVELATFREWAVDELGAVSHYAWSADSRFLAVAGVSDGVTQLGGLDLSALLAGDEPDAAGPSGSSAAPALLAPRVANVDSELTWFAGDHVAFHEPHPLIPGFRQVSLARAGSGGFDEPVTPGGVFYPSDLQLRPSPAGVFVAFPSTRDQDYLPVGGPATRQNDVIVSPAGSLKAQIDGAELGLFAPEDRTGALPRASVAGCERVLAWSADDAHIACDRARDGAHELIIVDVPAALSGLPSTAVMRELPPASDYPPGAHIERRRLFSPSARWLAFELDGSGHVAAVAGGVPHVQRSWPIPEAAAGGRRFEFSPDESVLLEQAGASLTLHRLETVPGERASVTLSSALAPAPACSEDFLAPDAGWCGAEPRARDHAWSPGSDFITFETADGQLVLQPVRFSADPIWPEAVEIDATCGAGCLRPGSARFQP